MSQLERLKHGTKLLLAGPDMIVNFMGGPKDLTRQFRSSDIDSMVSEYQAIYGLFSTVVVPENLVVIDNHTSWGYEYQRMAQAYISDRFRDICLTQIPRLHERNYYFPRDAHTFIGNEMVVNTLSWGNDTDGYSLGSCFGEGGACLSRGNTTIVSEDLARLEWYQFFLLKGKGNKIGTIPPPSIDLPGNFARNHIDGHVALIEDQRKGLNLLVADSYYQAARDRKSDIKMAAFIAQARLLVVNDRNLPPLAFNLVQFEDRTVGMTGGADDLEKIIRELVGDEFVYTTQIPLVEFPNRVKAGLRCLSNEAPTTYLSSPGSRCTDT